MVGESRVLRVRADERALSVEKKFPANDYVSECLQAEL
jgi:hypothetical protein